MDNNVNNSRSNEKQPSVGSKITSEEKKFTESASTFVNQAEIAWHERRHEWAGDLSQKSLRMPKDPILSWSLTYDDLLLTNDPFPQPIPLTSLWQMVKVCKPQGSGFSALLLTAKAKTLSIHLLFRYLLNISFFISGLYVLAPIYHTLTRSISSVSIWALTAFLLIVHLFLHDYAGSTIRPPGALTNPTLTSNISLNASIVASVLIASRLPSRLLVFAIVLFSLQVFLFAPLVTYCIKKYSFKLHLLFSFGLMIVTLGLVFVLHRLLFVLLFSLLIFVTILCPYWLIKIQEYKFEINGPWDEAKLCFDITE